MEEAREFQKNIYFCSLTTLKPLCQSQQTVENSSRDGTMGPSYLAPEKSVCRSRSNRIGHGTTEWFQIGKGLCQAASCHPAYLTYMQIRHAKYCTGWNTSWNQDRREKYQQPQICRWHHPMAESGEELKSLLMKVKEESEKAGLNLSIRKTKMMASGPITSWQIDGETMETDRLYLLGLQNHCRWWLQPWN